MVAGWGIINERSQQTDKNGSKIDDLLFESRKEGGLMLNGECVCVCVRVGGGGEGLGEEEG